MAELFLAKQVGLEGFEKVVAIKRILAHLAFDDEFINMFRDEARIVAKLSHPNIVQIYDLGKSDDSYFIAMEYIPGRNLSSVAKKAKLKGEKLPPEFIARCIAQACEGLYYAHTRQDIDGKPLKIVHRDVSPQNIILAFSGGVKLVDFGIAKAATKIAHTRAGVLKGKYAYMSPEQIRGDEVDARSDLFAVGIVLYELLCGRRPFEKENSIQTLKAIVQEQHVDCRLLNSDIPDGLASIIDKALSKTYADRWSSAQELQLALEDFVAGTGKRCNNIVISKWVTDLFAEELSRDRGGTMVFKGVGEIILPDLDDPKEKEGAASDKSAPKDEEPAEEISENIELSDARIPDDAGQDDGSGAVGLARGRGGGSVNYPPVARPPIPAPSTALGDLSGLKREDTSGRQAWIEEGVIEHGRRTKEDEASGFTDDKTMLAGEEPPKQQQKTEEADVGEPEMDPEVAKRAKSPALYDDSKTEFAPDLVPDQDIEEIGEDEDLGHVEGATWIPPQTAPSNKPSRGGSLLEDVGEEDELSAASDSDDADPWEDATVGYPDAQPPIPDDELAEFGADPSLSGSIPGIKDTGPPDRSGEAPGWGLSSEEKSSDDLDLWDDKTATNDAFLDDALPSPVVVVDRDRSDGHELPEGGDPTINSLSLSSDVLRAMGPGELSDESAEATMSGIDLGGMDHRRIPDPEITGLGDDDQPHTFDQEPNSMDATIAGMAALEDEENGESEDFSFDTETRRSMDDEPALPVPRTSKNVDSDSRTVAGVTSDFVSSGLKPPQGGAYERSQSSDEGVDVELSERSELTESPKPKPKRGGRGIGAIKLSKAPAVEAKVRRGHDFSEEMTDAGETAEESQLKNLPRPSSWEPELSPRDHEPTEGMPSVRSMSRLSPMPTARRRDDAAKLIEDAFDDFSLDDDVPPRMDPKPTRSPSLVAAKIPPPLNPPTPAPGTNGPAIGSTNVPPASLSLSEMLSIPIGQSSTRSGFQVLARNGSISLQNPPAASGAPVPSLRGRNNSVSRQIRETVRSIGEPPREDTGLRLAMPSADAHEGFQVAAPPLDFGLSQPPKSSRVKILTIMGVMVLLALLAIAAALVLPGILSKDPQLTIRTMPDGADIYLNGQLQPAKTPATLGGLQPGVTYELRLVREGHEPVSKAVPIPKNTRNILVQIPLRAAVTE
jgi:serine/threonine protein kinase